MTLITTSPEEQTPHLFGIKNYLEMPSEDTNNHIIKASKCVLRKYENPPALRKRFNLDPQEEVDKALKKVECEFFPTDEYIKELGIVYQYLIGQTGKGPYPFAIRVDRENKNNE